MHHAEWEDRLQELIHDLPREKRESDPDFEASEGYPEELRAEVTAEGIRIDRFGIVWPNPGAAGPNWTPERFLTWDDLGATNDPDHLVADELREVRRKRIRSYRPCRICHKINPSEWMLDRNTCMGCAEKHLGVVY